MTRTSHSHRRRSIAALLIAGALAIGMSACGGGGDSTDSSSGGSDQQQISAVITSAITADDETLCTDEFSQHFVEAITHEKGQKAIDACEKGLRRDNSHNTAIKVTNVKVTGAKATADVGFKADAGGGKSSPQSASFALVNEGGEWKIDAAN